MLMPLNNKITQTVTVEVVADRLGVSPWTVRTWLRQGMLPYIKIGKRVLMRCDDVEALIAQHSKPATRAR
jgi:excisionase family DNA binding protein